MPQPQRSRPQNDGSTDADGRLSAAISDAIVALIRDTLGRGPRRARTFIHDDVILCVQEETMTALERTLQDENRNDTMTEVREVLHTAMAPKAAQRVEALTGRTVLTTLADHHADPDAAAFVFILEPKAE